MTPEAFLALFPGRTDAHGFAPVDGKWLTKRQPLTPIHAKAHLAGEVRIGRHPLLPDGTCWWAVVDTDTGGVTPVLDIAATLHRYQIPFAVEQSKVKGYHLWIWFGSPVPAWKPRAVLQALVSDAGWPNVEVFPKQNTPGGEDGLGNFVWLPWHGGSSKTGRTLFLDLDASQWRPYPDQAAYLASVPKLPETALDRILREKGIRPPEQRPSGGNGKTALAGGTTTLSLPPCAAWAYAEGITSPGRGNWCHFLARYFRRRGLPEEATVRLLLDWNEKNKPDPLSAEEVRGHVHSAYVKEYTSLGCETLQGAQAHCTDACPVKVKKEKPTQAAPPYDDRGMKETVVELDTNADPLPGEVPTDTTAKKPAGTVLPFEVLPAPDYMCASFVGASRLVPGIGLTACGVLVLSGQGGDGKSVQALNLALGWTGDATLLPEVLRPTRPLKVILFMVEDSPGMVQERLTLMLGHEPAPANLLLFTRREPMQFGGSKGRPLIKALDRLAVTLARHTPLDVAMFDPLVYLHQAEENSASEMMRWLTPFREVCRQAGVALCIVHHAGWAPDGEDSRGRGSTAIRAWSDCELSLRAQCKGGKILHRLNLVKANFCPRWKEALTLELDQGTLRFNVVDEAETLCSTDTLAGWMVEDLNGVWRENRADFYAAVAKRFGCSDRTARRVMVKAIDEGKLKDHGQRKPLEAVVANSDGQLL